MERKITLFLMIFALPIAFGGVIEKSLDSFTKVNFIGDYKVKLVKSDSNGIHIDNKDTANVPDEHIMFEVINSELKVHIKQDLLSKKDILITVYYQSLKQVTVRRGGTLEATEIVTDSLKIIASTGAKITVPLNVKHVTASLSSGGSIRLKGVAQSADYSVNTGGTIAASFLDVKNVISTIKLGGEIILNATETLEIDIKAGGTVSHKGNPIITSQSVVLGGTIENLERKKDESN